MNSFAEELAALIEYWRGKGEDDESIVEALRDERQRITGLLDYGVKKADDDLEFRITKLEVRPDDVIVVKVDQVLTTEQAERIRAMIEKVLPDIRTLVMPRGVDITIVSKSERP